MALPSFGLMAALDAEATGVARWSSFSSPRSTPWPHRGWTTEVDIVIDLGAGRLIAAEVKATSAPTTKDARHLAWLREELGESFVRGIVFHTGRQPFELDTRIWPLPIATLWA